MKRIKITIVLSALALLLPNTPVSMAKEPLKRVLIKGVPYVKQKKNYCAPAAAAMLLKYYGAKVDQTLLANLASGQSAEHKGTSLVNLNESIKKMGYETSLLDLNTADDKNSKAKAQKAFRENTIPLIKLRLSENKPVLYCIKKTGWERSHLILIIGFDEGKQSIYYIDPDLSRSKIHRGSYKAFSVFGNIAYDGGYYQAALLVEPNSDDRYTKKRKKKEFESAKNTSTDIDYLKLALLDLQKQSIKKNMPLFEMLPPSGFVSNEINRFDFENIDLLRKDLKTSSIKSKRSAKKHSVPAIENNLANNKIVVLIYKEPNQKPNDRISVLTNKNNTETSSDIFDFLILTGYNKNIDKFTVLRPDDKLKDYTPGGLTYKELINRLNLKTKSLNKNGKEKKTYSHRVIIFSIPDKKS